MTHYPKAPPKLYLEIWPAESGRDAMVHFEQTGYGDDMQGNTSRIVEYVRADALARKPKRRKRVR